MRLNHRISRNVATLFLATAATCSVSTSRVFANAQQDEQLGKLAFAEELATAARQVPPSASSGSKDLNQAGVRRSATLLRAACEECNFEPRFPKLYAEASRQLNDRDAAIDGIKRYLKIPLPEVKNDQFALIELIDLNSATLEDDAKKIKYLREQVVPNSSLPAPVRSYFAVELSRLLNLRMDAKAAKGAIADALGLNPLNPDALQARYVETQTDGTAADRVTALVGILKTNPARPDVMGTLASELASAGQLDTAAEWYQRSFTADQNLSIGLDPDRYLDYAAVLQLTGQPRKADDATSGILSSKPSNARAATLKLLIARQLVNAPISGSHAADALVITRAQQALLSAIAAQIGSMDADLHGTSSTQPASTQPYDLTSTVDNDSPRLRAFHDAPKNETQTNFLGNYVAALANLTWYYLYFDPQMSKADHLLEVLKPLVAADDSEFTRLEGYSFLDKGKKDEAKVKFSAVADRDPLAKMGLILVDSDPAAAAELVTKYPSGILGATLIDGLRDKGGKFVADATSLAAADAAHNFPVEFLDFTAPGKAQQFYKVLAQPLRTAHQFDEPVTAVVSIENTGNYDLSVGNGAALRPDLWFDVFCQGGSNPHFEGVSYDRISGPLVLPAHALQQQGTLQTVRVDEGQLADYLAQHPTIALSMNFSVFLNPFSHSGGVAPGPGGYRQQFAQSVERAANPIDTPQHVQDVTKPALDGTPFEKIHGLRLLGDYIKYLRDQMSPPKPAAAAAVGTEGAGSMPPPGSDVGANAAPGHAAADAQQAAAKAKVLQPIIDLFTSAIQSELRDPSSLVRYRAEFEAAQLGDDNNRIGQAMTMLQGTDWQQRVLGLLLAATLPPERTRELAAIAQNDPVDFVKNLAQATVTLATPAPTTAPAAGPTSAPSTPALNQQ